ncbi:MAG: radical SAM protein [Theionarchaea archaeon]|nr:radical SAM protein [Theionarchaea archaeon]
MGLILSPDVKLRKDGGRSILFSVNPADSIEGPVFQILPPHYAMILSLLDGQRSLPDVEGDVARMFRLDSDAASKEVESLLNHPLNTGQTIRSFVVDASTIDLKAARIYDPYDFIMPAEYIDMSDTRCKMPCSLIVLPTMRCFTSCIYCYADRERMQGQQDFDMNFYHQLLKEAKACGIETVEISGGDLFCREDAFDLIQSTLSEGMYPTIPTKYPLSRKDVDNLADMGLSTIQISIDAHSPDIIDKMTGRPGYGRRILKTLDYLGEAGIRVRTNSVLTPYNIQDAVKLAYHLAHMPHVFKCNFTPYGRSLYRHSDTLFCSPDSLNEFARELAIIKDEFPRKPLFFSGAPLDPYSADEEKKASTFWERALCTANRRGVVVLPNGKVTICEELYFHEHFIIGDLTKNTLMEVWESPRALELAHPDQSAVIDGQCSNCPDFRRCHEERGRCFRDTLKAYGYNKPHWPDPRCPRASMGNRMG